MKQQKTHIDVFRSRKHNQSSLQIAANAIINEGASNRPSLIGAQGLPPKGVYDYNQKRGNNDGQLPTHSSEGDHNQSVDESAGNGDIFVDKNTDNYITELKKGNSNILVGVRCRPLSQKEKAKQSQKSVKIIDEKIVLLQDVSAAKPEEAFRQGRSKEKSYAFDYAFDETIPQEYVFEKTTKFLIDGIMQGYNASVFAYGATGAGKTYTMLGTEENQGIMMMSIQELFKCIEDYTMERDYKIKISYIEVYNEMIKDLLNDKNDQLELREDAVKGVLVANVMEIMTTNTEEIVKYIVQGNKARTKERTDANDASSRSHAVLQITVEHKDKAHGINAEINIAKLSLIDLAGSERASNTNNRGIRLVEGANINKSLLALGNCINALCEQAKSGGSNLKNTHIPYRDSKLTRLLKDSLGGNCRTVMIANISPAFTAYEDTYNTLKYADRAKQIKTIVKRNVLNVEFHIANYTKIITSLRDEILNLRNQLQIAGGPPPSKMNNQIQKGSSTPGNQLSTQQQNKIKKIKIDMNMQFEREVIVKKEIYELDMKNEDLAFKLFSKQLNMTKLKNKGQNTQQVETEIKQLKFEIDENYQQKALLQKRLTDFENQRNKVFEDYQQEMIEYEIEALDVIYNQHLLNLKSIDFKRKENRADFHIKQRDNYIAHLKEQLSIRDKIIKEKLGVSITNFMPGPNSNNSYGINSSFNHNEGISELFTMQDIDRMSRELILPSLNMTKSSSFIPNQQNPSLENASNKNYMNTKLEVINDSPYTQNSNVHPSPQQNRNLVNQSGSNKIKPQIVQQKYRQSPQHHYGSLNQRVSSIEEGKGYSNNIKQGNNLYTTNDQRYVKPIKSSGSVQSAGQYIVQGKNSYENQSYEENNKANDSVDIKNENKEGNVNFSFQSHRNNSHSRIGMGVLNYQNQIQSSAQSNNVLTSNQNDDNNPKSFAAEMSKNKQKFMMMQKQQISNPQDVFNTRGRAIPKNPMAINKKLTLLKKHANVEDSDTSQNQISSRNINQQASQNNLLAKANQNSSYGQRKVSDQQQNQIAFNNGGYIQNLKNNNVQSQNINQSIINIADNM